MTYIRLCKLSTENKEIIINFTKNITRFRRFSVAFMKFYRVMFLTEHLKTTGSQHRRLYRLLTVFPKSFISNSCNPKQLRTGLLQVNSCQNIRETVARKHRLDIASLQKYAAALPEKKYSISHQLVTQLKKHTVFVNSLRISIFHKCACSFSWYKIG